MDNINLVALIIFAGGIAITTWLFLWSRQRQNLGHIPDSLGRATAHDFTLAANDDAVMVSTEHGQVIYVNEPARRWFGMNGGDPNLEYIAQLAQPSESFLELFAGEGQSSFKVGKRWVEASSHIIPTGFERRIMVRMRELSAGTQNASVLDLNRTMAIINEIGETVNASMGIEQVLQILLTVVIKAVPAEAGEICLWDEKEGYLQQRGWVGDASYLLAMSDDGGIYRLDEGVSGWIARHRTPVLMGSMDDPTALRPKFGNIPFQSLVAVPLVLGQRFIGTFELFHVKLNYFSQADMALLQAVSTPIAVAIYNAELYSEQVQRVADIASLQQIAEVHNADDAAPIYGALNERVAKLMNAEMCGILLYDETRRGLLAQQPFYGLPDHVVRTLFIPLPPDSPQHDIWQNQPYWVSNDVVDEPLAETMGLMPLVEVAGIVNTAFMPLMIGEKRIGILAVSNKRADGGFTPRDIQNLRVLVAQSSIVVENVRLFQRERRIDAELVGLQDITHAIGALSHEGEFYSEITERIARLMNIAMCGILLYDEAKQALKSQLPFYGVADSLVQNYQIVVAPGSVQYQLWTEEDYWYSNRVNADTLVFEAELDELAEKIGVQKTLMAVLSASGRRLGVVQVSNKLNGEDFTENDARLLLIFATQAAAIIENARLYHEVQRSAAQAQSLRRVAELAGGVLTTEETFTPVLAEIARLTNSALVYINALDQQTGGLITYPRWTYGVELHEPIVQDIHAPGFEFSVAVSHQHYLSNDVFADERVLPSYRNLAQRFNITKAVIVPLVVADRSLGELGIANSPDRPYTQADVDILQTVASQIAAAIDRLLRYQATGQNLNRRIEELDAISHVSNELTLTLDLDKILDVIRHQAAQATGAEGSTVALLRPVNDWQNPNTPELARRLGESLAMPTLADIEIETISRGADTVLVSDYQHNTLRPSPPHVRSAIAASIMYVDQVVGVIHLQHSEPNRFDHQAAAFLMTLATKASLGYGNAVRYQEQVERSTGLRRRVEQLNQIFELGHVLQANTDPVDVADSIAYGVHQSVGFDTVVILLIDETQHALRRVAHAGMPVEVFEKTRDAVITLKQAEDLLKEEYSISESYFFPIEQVKNWYNEGVPALSTAYEGNRSLEISGKTAWHDGDLLVVTMRDSAGHLLGLMTLDRPQDNRRPDRGVIEVLEIFAHQAATTIESNRLYMSSIRSAEQEARLNEVMEAIAQTLDIDEIFESVARGAQRLVAFNQLTVALVDSQEQGFDFLKVTVKDDGTFNITRDRRHSLERTALGRTYAEGVDYLYQRGDADIETYQDLWAWHQGGEHISLLLPLLTGGKCLGAIHIGGDEVDAPAFVEFRPLLKRMGQLVASAVQNARLFDQAVNLEVLNQSVVRSIQQGIVVLDNSGRILSINDFMRQRYGWSDDALREDLFEYRPSLAPFLASDLREVLETGTPREHVEQPAVDERGHTLISNYYVYPLRFGENVRGAVMMVEDVTERSRLEQDIAYRANQLAALTDVSTRITASLEREEVVNLALKEMGKIIQFDRMLMWRRNGSFMVLEGVTDMHQEAVAEEVRVRFNMVDRMRQVVETQRVVCVNEPNGLTDEQIGETGMRSWLGVPLVSQGHVVGMIVLVHHLDGLYNTVAEQHVAFAFASQVAIALANAELFEQTFDRTNELGTLLEASLATAQTRELDEVFRTVVELMFNVLDMDDCAIMLWDEVDNALEVQVDMNRYGDANRITPKGTRFNLSEHPAKMRALRDRDVLVIMATDKDTPYPEETEELSKHGDVARMFVPLVVGEQSIGLIQLEQRTGENVVLQQKVRLARALSSQVAIAIQNARLSSETTAQFEELLIINELSRTISSTLNLDKMIAVVRDQVPRVVEATELYLALYDEETQEITYPLAVRQGEEFIISPRKLSNDEVSFIIKHRQPLSLGADYYGPDEMRKNLGITNGEGDFKSYMGVPIEAGDKVVGVLAVRDSARTRAFTLNDRRILTTVGSQLGAAIQNVRLFDQVRNFADDLNRVVQERTQELERERDRIDTLYQITSELTRTLDMDRLLGHALGMVAKAVNADDGAIMRIDPLTDALYSQAILNPQMLHDGEEDQRPQHPAERLASWLIENDHEIVVHDLHEVDFWDKDAPGASEWRSALAVLLETNEDIQGVMVLLSRAPAAFDEDQVRLLVAAANQVASAINNADLYQLIRDQAERLGSLLRAEQEEAEKSHAILEGIADGVLLADAEGVVILFNSAAERILHLPREQVLGQQLSKLTGLYTSTSGTWVQAIENWANRDWSAASQSDEGFLDERLDLGDRVVSVHLSSVHIGENFLGTVSVFRDITRDVEVDRLKSEFVSNVSHELRTPLTPIKGYTDLLLVGAVGKITDQQSDALQKIKDNVERLTTLVEDVLDISKIDSGREHLLLAPTNIAEVVETVLERLKARHDHRKELEVTFGVDADVPEINVDAEKVAQIIRNVADNAFNYTPAHGKVDIHVSMLADGKNILIAIKDTGVGIPEDFQEAIWRRFERYEEHALMMDVAGTGLGLPIAKELVTMHNGKIYFESTLGQGTTFYIELPIEQPERSTMTSTAEVARINPEMTKE